MDSIEISPQQALARQQAGARLIDLRDLDERATGMAAGAQAIALAQVLDAPLQVLPQRDQALLLICARGQR